jgi:DNA invertase Pin-like site-specific DNA recombinase
MGALLVGRAMQFLVYLRVSTRSQCRSGLGLDAQRAAVEAYILSRGGEIQAEFVEIESGRKADRPRLQEAIRLAKKSKLVLVIAKLDRLARDVHFISGLMKSGIDFVACDMPAASPLTLHIMAAMAEHEAELISLRTKAALAQARARGVRLGGIRHDLANARAVHSARARARHDAIAPVVAQVQTAGARTLAEIAAALDARGITAPRGGSWSPSQVSRIISRMENAA